MRRLFAVHVLLFLIFNIANAQIKTPANADTARVKSPQNKIEKFAKSDSAYHALAKDSLKEKYFKTDSADLKLTSCDFEKDANAMVLFDMASIAFGGQGIIMERHRRIKIFNNNGKDEANIRIEYNNKFGAERILAVIAKTINLKNGKIEFTKLDSSLIYNVHTDKQKDAIVFTMPNVNAGSIIEYDYIWERTVSRNFPDWAFQCEIPTRYSQLSVLLNPEFQFTLLNRTNQPFVKDTVSFGGYGHIWAMANVPSSKQEPFMRSAVDALQKISLVLSAVKTYGQTQDIAESWATIGKQITSNKEFAKPYDQNLNGIDDLLKKAKALKTYDEKIAFLFNQVKTQMNWNSEENWISKDGIKSAWKKKSGNWGEINMILGNLLKQASIQAYPLLVSTRDNGILYTNFVNIFQVNKLVIYVPVDSSKYYILDATEKYNVYNEIPFDLLNSNGLYLDKEHDKYGLVFMNSTKAARQSVLVNAEIKPDGTMEGTAEISSYSYIRANALQLYKTLDEKNYEEYLTNNDNNLNIISLKLNNLDVDSLPLIQDIAFKLDLSVTDDKYIYFNPNLFTSLHDNPFLSEHRAADIDFGSPTRIAISGKYKIPDGYTIESLPKSLNIVMGDNSITFRRTIAEEDGYIVIYYVINYKNPFYSKTDYPDIYAYFKKMFENLNEQIVLKKS